MKGEKQQPTLEFYHSTARRVWLKDWEKRVFRLSISNIKIVHNFILKYDIIV